MVHIPEAQRNGVITLTLFLSALAIVVVLIAGNNYFRSVKFAKHSAAAAVPNPLLVDLRTREATDLNTQPRWNDQANGVVRIGIERAMELVAAEDRRRRESGGGE